jgi:hypothetical protein
MPPRSACRGRTRGKGEPPALARRPRNKTNEERGRKQLTLTVLEELAVRVRGVIELTYEGAIEWGARDLSLLVMARTFHSQAVKQLTQGTRVPRSTLGPLFASFAPTLKHVNRCPNALVLR